MLLVLFACFSCQKEEIQISAQPKFLVSSICLDTPITVVNGMLSFNSEEHFTNTLECLQLRFEDYTKDFVSSCNTSNDDSLDYFAENLSFDPNVPLKNFESQFIFNSLRNSLEQQLNIYESSDVLVSANDPYNNWAGDEVVWSLLNTNGSVRIGGKLFNFSRDSMEKAQSGSCYIAQFPDHYTKLYNNSNRRVIARFAHWGTPGFLFHPDYFVRQCKIINQRKKSSGDWVSAFTNLHASYNCKVKNTNCDSYLKIKSKVSGAEHSQSLNISNHSLRWVPPWVWEFPVHNRNCKSGDNGDRFAWGPLENGTAVDNYLSYNQLNVFSITW